MSILYGTTSDGNTLPVQVDEFGRLVSFGAQGPEGKPGPPGPSGPGASAELVSGSWTPIFGSNDPNGAAVINYAYQEGYWFRYGPLLTAHFYVETDSVFHTNARGDLVVGGLPPEAGFAAPSVPSFYGPFHIAFCMISEFGPVSSPLLMQYMHMDAFLLGSKDAAINGPIPFASLSSNGNGQNVLVGSFSGLASDAARSVPLPLDGLM